MNEADTELVKQLLDDTGEAYYVLPLTERVRQWQEKSWKLREQVAFRLTSLSQALTKIKAALDTGGLGYEYLLKTLMEITDIVNAALSDLSAPPGDKRTKLHFTNEWLRNQIEKDADLPCEVGPHGDSKPVAVTEEMMEIAWTAFNNAWSANRRDDMRAALEAVLPLYAHPPGDGIVHIVVNALKEYVDPGSSDNEQPINLTIRCTLGDIRKARRELP